MNKTDEHNYLRTVLLKQQAPVTQKDTGRARARGNIGITISDKVARGRARGINNMSKETKIKRWIERWTENYMIR